jgi:hypothetical protein
MIKRQKCSHCGKVADFFHDFCTLCWAHRTRGSLLKEDEKEQLASERAGYEKELQRKAWQQKFERWQHLVIVPAVWLTLSSLYWLTHKVAPALAGAFPVIWLLVPVVCVIGFALGGWLVGGGTELTLGSSLLMAIALIYGSFCITLMQVEYAEGAGQSPARIFFNLAELAACGLILWGAVQILRLGRNRP